MLLDNFINYTIKVEEEDKRKRQAQQRSRAEVRRESAVARGVEARQRVGILSGSNPAIPKGTIRANVVVGQGMLGSFFGKHYEASTIRYERRWPA